MPIQRHVAPMHEECNATTIDLSGDANTVVCPGPCVLLGVYVNVVLSAHAVELLDGAAVKFTLPASLAAGSERNFRGTRMETSLSVDPNTASTGSITVFWMAA